jgi:hypothetical protein
LAVFNPQLTPSNDQAQTYLRNFSRPVDAPRNIEPTGVEPNKIYPEGTKVADRSAEYLGEAGKYSTLGQGQGYTTFGDVFGGLVTGADALTKMGDQLIRTNIDNQVQAQARNEQDRYITQLEAIKSGQVPGLQGTKSIMDANASMDTPTDKQPTELENLPQQLDTVSQGQQQGKINNVDYWRNLDVMSRDLRTRYPGYASYIDQEFAKVTGQIPANARINQLVSAINQGAASANAEKTKAFAELGKYAGYFQPDEFRALAQGINDGKLVKLQS